MIRLYAGCAGLDVATLWIGTAFEQVRHLPTGTLDERKARADALIEALSRLPRRRARPATPSRV
jgi:hypothetical protein